MTIRFLCGCAPLEADDVHEAICRCGERRIQSVVARAPRFRGACRGPLCETKALEPIALDLAPGLTLKESYGG